MTSIASFGDFILVTTEAFLRGRKDVLHEAVNKTYLFGKLLYGAGMSDALQGGAKISDAVTLEDPGTAQFFGSDSDTFVWKNPQLLKGWSVEWRKAMGHFSWTEDEKGLQGVENMTREARFKVFKDVYTQKVQGAYQSLYNLFEGALWAEPDDTTMETTDAGVPYSIPTFINEGTNGIHQSWGATTIQGIAPGTFARWRCATATYTEGSEFNPAPTAPAINVMDGFTKLHLRTTYQGMQGAKAGVFQPTSDRKRYIACSEHAWSGYSNLTRADQDHYRYGPNDGAQPNPMNKGVELLYVEALDEAALYPADSGTTLSNDEGTTAGVTIDVAGPRYYLLDCEYIRPVFHVTDFIKQHPQQTHPNQPLSHVVPITAKYNLVNRSLQRCGLLHPVAAA